MLETMNREVNAQMAESSSNFEKFEIMQQTAIPELQQAIRRAKKDRNELEEGIYDQMNSQLSELYEELQHDRRERDAAEEELINQLKEASGEITRKLEYLKKDRYSNFNANQN